MRPSSLLAATPVALFASFSATALAQSTSPAPAASGGWTKPPAPPPAAATPGPLPPLPPPSGQAPPGSTSSAASPPGAAQPPPYMVQEPYEAPPDAWGQAQPGAPPQPAQPYDPRYAPPAYTPGYPPPPTYPGYAPYPPPYGYYYEPPPPPPVRHRAPSSSLWLGGKLGLAAPMGRVYGDAYSDTGGVQMSEIVGSQSSLELDIGGRIARRWVVYGGLELDSYRLGSPSTYFQQVLQYGGVAPGASESSANGGFAGLGFRWTSHPDEVGFLVDFSLGYRWITVKWDDGSQLTLNDPFEARLGFGADIRVSRTWSFSPMLAFTSGDFTSITLKPGNGGGSHGLANDYAGHGSIGLVIGGHADLLPSP